MIRLLSVHRTPGAVDVLYKLLLEREQHVSISHKKMPTLSEHRAFVRSKPYKAWYLIADGKDFVGATYLSKQNEIGLFIFKKFRGKGYGKRATAALMIKHAAVKRFLANVAPSNPRSIGFFKGMGFKHIQNTYELVKGRKIT